MAKVMEPFGKMISGIVAEAERRSEFKVVSCKKPKALKKLQRIVEKVALRPQKDGCIASVCDCVRMMVPVKKMMHIAHLLRALCNPALVQSIANAIGVDRFELVRAKERFFESPSAGGWRDVMLNFFIQVGDAKQVCELQIVHETMLSARAGLPGHAIYNRVRNASELVEYMMGSAFAFDALRLAALRLALGDETKDEESFPSGLNKMKFNTAKLDVECDGDGHVKKIVLGEGQIPTAAFNVLLS